MRARAYSQPPGWPRAGERLGALVADARLRALAVVHTASFGLSVVVGNWIVPLLERDGHGLRAAGLLGSLVLLGGLVTRPGGGWLATRHPQTTGRVVAASLLVFAGSVALLAAPVPLPVRALAAALAGLAAGMPFAPAFAGAQRARRGAPAAAVGFVNASATLAIVAGTPLLGLAFTGGSSPRTGFVLVATAIAAAALAARRLSRDGG